MAILQIVASAKGNMKAQNREILSLQYGRMVLPDTALKDSKVIVKNGKTH